MKIKNALISVYNKNGLENLVKYLHENNVNIYSTGGTSKVIKDLNIPVNEVENLTSYPSILGGRVKTLHPKIFGGILARRENQDDLEQLQEYEIPQLDLVVVDLYPFEDTMKNSEFFQDIIEKIDIGGVSLIRAAAKNFNDVTVLCDQKNIDWFVENNKVYISKNERFKLASAAFDITMKYDTLISKWMQSQLQVINN